jgi:hypothetical protein
MLTGRHPFAEATTSDLLAAILRNEPQGLCKLNSAVPAELERIILKTLRKDRPSAMQAQRICLPTSNN